LPKKAPEMGHKNLFFFTTTIMTTKTHRYALRALCAANLAPELADEIQSLHFLEVERASYRTIEIGKQLITSQLAALPSFLRVELDEDELALLVSELLD
jgi:hypothetical protein